MRKTAFAGGVAWRRRSAGGRRGVAGQAGAKSRALALRCTTFLIYKVYYQDLKEKVVYFGNVIQHFEIDSIMSVRF